MSDSIARMPEQTEKQIIHDALKFALQRVMDLDLKLAALQIALKNHGIDVTSEATQIAEDLEKQPPVQKYRELVETLEEQASLELLAKFDGRAQL